jgi:hypothetical protein
MGLLNKIIAYWYDCIKNEDILEKDISINVRSKAVLYPFDNDPFVFDKKENLIFVSGNEKLTAFSEYITTRGYEPYYGYYIAPNKFRVNPCICYNKKQGVDNI